MVRIRGSLGTVLVLALGWGWALAPALAWASPVPVPALTAPLMDGAGLARGPLAARLQAELEAVRRDAGVQLVLLTLPTLSGEEPAPFAHRVMEAWRLGQKGSDLGLLLLVAPEDRTTRLEVGYGLEGVLPDALAKQILADVLAPKEPQAALTGAHLLHTVQVLHRLLQGARQAGQLPEVAPDGPRAPEGWPLPLWALALGVVAVWLFARFLLSFMPKEAAPSPSAYGRPHRSGRIGPRGGGALWHTLVQLLLALLSGGGGRGGPPAGGGYSGGGGRSGGGGASDKY